MLEASLLCGLALVWVSTCVWVVVARAKHDVRIRVIDLARRVAGRRLAGTAFEEKVEVDRILRRLSTKTVLRAVGSVSTRTPVARVFSRHLLRRAEPEIRDLLDVQSDMGGCEDGIAALRVAALGGLPDADALLDRALLSSDEEVRSAAIQNLGELDSLQARRVLVESLRVGTFVRSRVAAQLEGRSPISLRVLRPLLEDARPIARYWGAILLAPLAHEPEARDALLIAAVDDRAEVRAGAAESLRRGHSGSATQMLISLLRDRSARVCIHAARSLGRRRAVVAAKPLASLLRDSNWSVRRAAKGALVEIGGLSAAAVSPLLDGKDEFARNGAAEVLQGLGVVRGLVDDLEESTESARRAAAADLAPILSAGGDGFTTAALGHLGEAADARAHHLIDSVP